VEIDVVGAIKLNNDRVIRLVKGDITKRNVGAIINAGVAAATVRKGGEIIQKESNKMGFIPVGLSVITTSGRLLCKAIIYTVGPRMGKGNEDHKLRKSVKISLELASTRKFKSISTDS
jgi:O-acetyl-ADP-ribose deacetylase (regulator of RNase III)